jgi:hypothetical protein
MMTPEQVIAMGEQRHPEYQWMSDAGTDDIGTYVQLGAFDRQTNRVTRNKLSADTTPERVAAIIDEHAACLARWRTISTDRVAAEPEDRA